MSSRFKLAAVALTFLVMVAFLNCGEMATAPNMEYLELNNDNEVVRQMEKDHGLTLMGDVLVPNEMVMTEGDSLDDHDQKAAGFFDYRSGPWPQATVVYKFAQNENSQRRRDFQRACESWTKGSNASCREATSVDRYYVRITSDEGVGCWATLGYNQQYEMKANLNRRCWSNFHLIQHEIGHMLGLIHEQQRPDRDEYIRVNMDNVQSGFEHAYNKVSSQNRVYGEYDFNSIMHYPATSYSKNGQPVMVSLPGNPSVPRDIPNRLTKLDQTAMQDIYGVSQENEEEMRQAEQEQTPSQQQSDDGEQEVASNQDSQVESQRARITFQNQIVTRDLSSNFGRSNLLNKNQIVQNDQKNQQEEASAKTAQKEEPSQGDEVQPTINRFRGFDSLKGFNNSFFSN